MPVLAPVIQSAPDLLALSDVSPANASQLIRSARELGYTGLISTETAQDATVLQEGKPVTAADIDLVEKMGDELSLKLISTPPEDLLNIEALSGYKFQFADMFGMRGDIVNKDMPRS